MSLCKLRTMIMATMTVRNNTMSSEFTIDYQCTLSGPVWKSAVIHRSDVPRSSDAHLDNEARHSSVLVEY